MPQADLNLCPPLPNDAALLLSFNTALLYTDARV